MDAHRRYRLKLLIETRFKGNRADFLGEAGIGKARLSQLLQEGATFGERAARSIEKALDLPDRYLDKDAPGSTEQPFDRNTRPAAIGSRVYPVISYVQAGALKEISDPYPPGAGFDQEFGDDVWSRWTFALEIEGDSMLPDFKPGDRVLVDPDLAPAPGDFVVARNNGFEATFKKYRLRGINATGQQVFELVPMNPDYETLRSDFQPLTIIGVMVEHRRKFKRPRD